MESFALVLLLSAVVVGTPHHHHHYYKKYLKDEESEREHRSVTFPEEEASSYGYGTSTSNKDSANGASNVATREATIAPIITGPGGSSSSGSSDTSFPGESVGGNLPGGSFQPPTSDPNSIRRVNDGLRTILGGVRSLSLEQILRGSFKFTRNDNVRSVANTVLDSIFGQRREIPQAEKTQ